MYKAPNSKFFEDKNLTPPSVSEHGTDEDIREKLKPLKVTSWHMEGNKLIGQTEMGEVVNYLSTDIIMTGVDEDNLPILTRIKV